METDCIEGLREQAESRRPIPVAPDAGHAGAASGGRSVRQCLSDGLRRLCIRRGTAPPVSRRGRPGIHLRGSRASRGPFDFSVKSDGSHRQQRRGPRGVSC